MENHIIPCGLAHSSPPFRTNRLPMRFPCIHCPPPLSPRVVGRWTPLLHASRPRRRVPPLLPHPGAMDQTPPPPFLPLFWHKEVVESSSTSPPLSTQEATRIEPPPPPSSSIDERRRRPFSSSIPPRFTVFLPSRSCRLPSTSPPPTTEVHCRQNAAARPLSPHLTGDTSHE
jgi:hypothetical protein